MTGNHRAPIEHRQAMTAKQWPAMFWLRYQVDTIDRIKLRYHLYRWSPLENRASVPLHQAKHYGRPIARQRTVVSIGLKSEIFSRWLWRIFRCKIRTTMYQIYVFIVLASQIKCARLNRFFKSKFQFKEVIDERNVSLFFKFVVDCSGA